MKRVLVTGATGFIGRHCLSGLLKKKYQVYATSREMPHEIPADIHWFPANLLNHSETKRLLEKIQPTHLLHLAWDVTPGQWPASPENFLWVQAGLQLIRDFYKCGGGRVVMAGSCAEYDWSYGYCSEYQTPKIPNTFYGICKNVLQILLKEYSEVIGCNSAWGRVFHVYGPHENPTRLVSSVFLSLLKGQVARCTHGNQVRDYLHVQDVADGFVALLDSSVSGAVNLASGRPVILKDLIGQIGRQLNRQHLIEFNAIPSPLHDPPLLVADVSRVTDELGWQPKLNLNEGLVHTGHWWQQHCHTIGSDTKE